MKHWFQIENIEEIDSPSLVIYKDRALENIQTLIKSIDDVSRLRPHIKTHKSPHITTMMLEQGITKFKCATIAEAEMLATAGAKDIVLAYQPVGPKTTRFLNLVNQFPEVTFCCLIDSELVAGNLSRIFSATNRIANVFIDLNIGMNRTGIPPEDALALIMKCLTFKSIEVKGLHAYDGHIRDEDFSARKEKSDLVFQKVFDLQSKAEAATGKGFTIIAGGTPTYSVHAKRSGVECSPGTFIYWDKGYEKILKEQHYLHAAIVITRVISKPSPGIICVDLGHKSIASENPLQLRVHFLNAPDIEPIGHSEEHMVLRVKDDSLQIGDVLYGVPYHVCPTIALYERSGVAIDGKISDWWMTVSRNRKITI
jgi:D-threonine aldolase